MIIAITNQKGGVGKTTTTLNLGCALREAGKSVLLIDLDPQGNLTSCLIKDEIPHTMYHVFTGEKSLMEIVQHPAEIDLCPADIELSVVETQITLEKYFLLRDQLQGMGGYDYILIDCPPSLNLFAVNAMIASDFLIIPVTTEIMSLKGLNLLIQSYQDTRRRSNPALQIMGILFTKFDVRNGIDKEILKIDTGDVKKFETIIRRSIELKEMPGHLQSIIKENPKSRGAEDYRAFAAEVMAHE